MNLNKYKNNTYRVTLLTSLFCCGLAFSDLLPEVSICPASSLFILDPRSNKCYKDCDFSGTINEGDVVSIEMQTGVDDGRRSPCNCKAPLVLGTFGFCYVDCDGNGSLTPLLDVPLGNSCPSCTETQVLHAGRCYEDCNSNRTYDSGEDVLAGGECVTDGGTPCGAGEIVYNRVESSYKLPITDPPPPEEVCLVDCNNNGRAEPLIDVPSGGTCACQAGEIGRYSYSSDGTISKAECYKECTHGDNILTTEFTGGNLTRKTTIDVCPLPCASPKYFNSVVSTTECSVDCLNDSGTTSRPVAESAIANSCYVPCPDGNYKKESEASECQKNCPGGTAVTVSEKCPEVESKAGITAGITSRTRVFQSRYSVGRVDRPDYICRHKEITGTNGMTSRSNRVYTGYYCPPLNECGNACKCRRKDNGAKVNNTVCEYASLEPFRMDGSKGITGNSDTIHKEIAPLGAEIATTVIPK